MLEIQKNKRTREHDGGLTLPLLMLFRARADHVNAAPAAHDLAVFTYFLDGGTNFHGSNPSEAAMIATRTYLYR